MGQELNYHIEKYPEKSENEKRVYEKLVNSESGKFYSNKPITENQIEESKKKDDDGKNKSKIKSYDNGFKTDIGGTYIQGKGLHEMRFDQPMFDDKILPYFFQSLDQDRAAYQDWMHPRRTRKFYRLQNPEPFFIRKKMNECLVERAALFENMITTYSIITALEDYFQRNAKNNKTSAQADSLKKISEKFDIGTEKPETDDDGDDDDEIESQNKFELNFSSHSIEDYLTLVNEMVDEQQSMIKSISKNIDIWEELCKEHHEFEIDRINKEFEKDPRIEDPNVDPAIAKKVKFYEWFRVDFEGKIIGYKSKQLKYQNNQIKQWLNDIKLFRASLKDGPLAELKSKDEEIAWKIKTGQKLSDRQKAKFEKKYGAGMDDGNEWSMMDYQYWLKKIEKKDREIRSNN